MLAGGFVPKCLCKVGQVEGSVNYRFDSGCVDGTYHLQLLLTAADGKTLKLLVSVHQSRCWDRASETGEDSDESDVASNAAGGD